MEELEEMIKWIDNYEVENDIFPHPNLIRMRMKLRVKDIKAKNNDALDLVVPSAFVMVIDDKEVVMLAENIADAMDKAEATGSKDYKMGFHKSFDVLH
jgi:hypothetical protein